MLVAKKFTQERFAARGGYVMHTGSWGVMHSETREWVSFSGKLYIPQGGRKAALEVASECDPGQLEYIKPMEAN